MNVLIINNMCIIGLLIYILIYKHPIQVYGAIRIYIYIFIKRNRKTLISMASMANEASILSTTTTTRLLACDVGTGSVRVGIFDLAGKLFR